MNKSSKAVEVSTLTKTYPKAGGGMFYALREISLSVEKGTIYGIIGRSGAGKSTLLRCLNGLETPDCGDILINAHKLTGMSREQQRPILHKIGMVYQSFNLLQRRNVLQNIALPLEFSGLSQDSITAKVMKMAELVGLSDKHEAYPSQLSGGQRQRVAIARALVGDVSLLLCDEFTSSLDPETTLEILALLKGLNAELGVTIVLITHDMSVIKEICDDVCVLDQGQIVEEGDVGSILLHPQHEVTQSLASSLFTRDLPQPFQVRLTQEPTDDSQAILKLLFSGESARKPIITSIIETFHVPVNIIAGSLDHIREVAFGHLIVTIPYSSEGVSNVLAFFEEHGVSAELLGYLPPQ